MLVQVLLDELLANYEKVLEDRVRQPDLTTEERLRLLIVICLEDIAGKRTTRLFTELWALANHNEFIADRVRGFYQRVHDFIGEYVAVLNPALSEDEVRTVAIYISASMEGSTPSLVLKSLGPTGWWPIRQLPPMRLFHLPKRSLRQRLPG
jgi:hypothetical protein